VVEVCHPLAKEAMQLVGNTFDLLQATILIHSTKMKYLTISRTHQNVVWADRPCTSFQVPSEERAKALVLDQLFFYCLRHSAVKDSYVEPQ
jgi:hypothetical protein